MTPSTANTCMLRCREDQAAVSSHLAPGHEYSPEQATWQMPTCIWGGIRRSHEASLQRKDVPAPPGRPLGSPHASELGLVDLYRQLAARKGDGWKPGLSLTWFASWAAAGLLRCTASILLCSQVIVCRCGA